MNFSVPVLFAHWQRFRCSKKKTREFDTFTFHLEVELQQLSRDLSARTYCHGSYHSFLVADPKRRKVAVAPLRDRFVHHVLSAHLRSVVEKRFFFDHWSGRQDKGLHGAIRRAQRFLGAYADGYFWRFDIHHCFQSIDHAVLRSSLRRHIQDTDALWLSDVIIRSFERERELPIGNLTSQMFAALYLHELDFFLSHVLHVSAWLRYGDDVVLFASDQEAVSATRLRTVDFLKGSLHLSLHPVHDRILPCRSGLHILGCRIRAHERRIFPRTWRRVRTRLRTANTSSYAGMMSWETIDDKRREWAYRTLRVIAPL